ncbi:MAG: NAD-dependent epimerase/dehydratase family protein [Armatimonadota bacterium]|nr:NAD-dependent epimerase/dehydratase family protein [Armatimonadota bacterium]MDW8290916.1 NAD-dependent epimerase/dehydratase family protein [Armatimonadota bacterium]
MSATAELHVVTGAFGYSGKYIARRLLGEGKRVRTLTNSPGRRNPFGSLVEAHPYHFDQPDELVRSLEGAAVLYNTYWVRFDHRDFTHSQAVQNTLTLFSAARRAGVRRVVHVSITNPSLASPLPYFRGKAQLEEALKQSGMSYAILRPTVLFGREDILINNIAWMLRTFPLFAVFGDGSYRLQPIYVDDLAGLAVHYGQRDENVVVDAIGPETFTYRELVQTIADAIGVKRPIIGVPPSLGLLVAKVVGYLMKDIVITREEVAGLMANLLVTSSPPAGKTRFSEWVRENAHLLGRRYHSELARRRDRRRSYEEL